MVWFGLVGQCIYSSLFRLSRNECIRICIELYLLVSIHFDSLHFTRIYRHPYNIFYGRHTEIQRIIFCFHILWTFFVAVCLSAHRLQSARLRLVSEWNWYFVSSRAQWIIKKNIYEYLYSIYVWSDSEGSHIKKHHRLYTIMEYITKKNSQIITESKCYKRVSELGVRCAFPDRKSIGIRWSFDVRAVFDFKKKSSAHTEPTAE